MEHEDVRHHVNSFLSPSEGPEAPERVLIIVNSQDFSGDLMRMLWDRCSHRFCADGGANRLYDWFASGAGGSRVSSLDQYIPDTIVGDLDSIRDDVREYYTSKGTVCVEIADQDNNDLEKCLSEATSVASEAVILGGFGGRFDQQMASIQALYKNKDVYGFEHVIIVDVKNVAFLLEVGSHIIELLHDTTREDTRGTPGGHRPIEGPTCGLLPIGGPAIVSTQGLQWDLNESELVFGGLVSTSNKALGARVAVQTSHPIVWTVQIHPLLPGL
jgi:thiamine pyrophosphokinase